MSRRDHFYHKLEERLKLDELSICSAIERNVISTALTNDEYGEIIVKAGVGIHLTVALSH